MLALGRRPLHQERARPDPPQQETAAGSRRGCGRSASQGRAGLILIETLRTMTLSTLAEASARSPRRRKSSPVSRSFSSASKAPTSSVSSAERAAASCGRPWTRPSRTAPPSTRSRLSSGRGRRVLALGRRPLHQERARPDPPTAGDRPRDRDVGAGARRPCRRPRGAHPGRDPADDDALHPRRISGEGARRRKSCPVSRSFSSASKAPTSSVSSGSARRPRNRPRPRPARARRRRQAPVRKGLSPEAVAAIREAVEGRPRPPERAVTSAPVDPWNPAESHLIPLNPGESRPENVSGRRALSRPGPAAVRNSPPPRRPAVPPATSWPDLFRPSIGPPTLQEA